jgi:hypothetical protein
VLARRFWLAWKQALLVVTPETVVRWHRAGFRQLASKESIERLGSHVDARGGSLGCHSTVETVSLGTGYARRRQMAKKHAYPADEMQFTRKSSEKGVQTAIPFLCGSIRASAEITLAAGLLAGR